MYWGDLLDVARVTALATAYLVVVGSAVRIGLSRVVTPARGLGLSVGLGLAASGAAVTLAFVVLGDAVTPVVVVGGAAVLVLLAVAVRAALPGGTGARAALADLLPTRWDAVALVAGAVVLAPLAAHGLAYWTSLANDFPSYVGSVETWVADSGHGAAPFRSTHPDAFGAFQERRAMYEKPMATGMLVVAALAGGTPAYGLLGPMTAVSFIAFLATLLTLVRRSVRLGDTLTALVVLVPTFSIVPFSRVVDAQLGHLLALTLLVTLLAVLVAPVRTGTGRWAAGGHVVAVGVVAAATVGTNATLVLGTGIGTAALLAWLVHAHGLPWRRVALRTAAGAAVAVAVSAPVLDWYLRSLRNQTTGELGYPVPLASPFSLIGMQTTLRATSPTGQALLEWVVVLVGALLVYLAAKRRRPGLPATGVLVLGTVANGALIVAVNDLTSYATHKWMSVAVALVVPFVLARAVERAAAASAGWTTAGASLLTAGSTAIAVAAATATPVVVPTTVLDLADDPRLSGPRTVNVALGDLYLDSIAPYAVPAQHVVSASRTYAASSPPIGSTFLLTDERADAWPTTRTTGVGDDLVLAEVDLTLDEGTTLLGADDPAGERYLYGRWGALEETGSWSTGAQTSIAFDVPDDLRGVDLELTLSGARFADPDEPRTLVVAHGDDTLARRTFREGFRPVDLVVPLSAGRVSATDGRVVLTLETPRPLAPASLGGEDTRLLSYWLGSLTLAEAT